MSEVSRGPREQPAAPGQPDGGRPPAEPFTRVTLRPMASPLTLGFLALAVGTFTLAGLQLSWVAVTQSRDVGLVLLVFVFPLQALSSVYGFLTRDTVAGTGMALLSGSWLAIGVVTFTSPPGRTSGALGLLLLGAATVLLVPAAVAAAGKPLDTAVIACVSLRFYLTAAYEISSAPVWEKAAAAIGLLLAALAFYAGLAFEVEDNRGRTVLPTLRRGASRTALTGSMTEELSGLYREAGVRKKL